MSAPNTTQNGQIVKKTQQKQAKGLAPLLEKMGDEIRRALPKHVPADRMARVCMTALRSTKNLDRCDPMSFLGCVMSAAQLGLEPNTPLQFCFLIPRENKRQGTWECTLMIGYQGMLDMCRRSGHVASVYAHVVHEGDEFTYQLGLQQSLKHVPCNEPGKATHVYAVAKLKDDSEPIFVVLSHREIEARRSRGFGGGPWKTDWEAMAMKTAIRALWRWLPKSSEIAAAIQLDVANEDGRPSALAFDPEVRSMLLESGVEAPEPTTIEVGDEAE
jgi:recombination protein RecT